GSFFCANDPRPSIPAQLVIQTILIGVRLSGALPIWPCFGAIVQYFCPNRRSQSRTNRRRARDLELFWHSRLAAKTWPRFCRGRRFAGQQKSGPDHKRALATTFRWLARRFWPTGDDRRRPARNYWRCPRTGRTSALG